LRAFHSSVLAAALEATFRRRGTALPSSPPLAFTAEFFKSPAKQTQWRAFLRKRGLEADAPFEDVVKAIGEFILPVVEGIVSQKNIALVWPPGSSWSKFEPS